MAAGKAADLVVLAGNRAKNIDDVERVETVFKDGVGSRGLSPDPSLQRTRPKAPRRCERHPRRRKRDLEAGGKSACQSGHVFRRRISADHMLTALQRQPFEARARWGPAP
jgi:hypothetical protein